MAAKKKGGGFDDIFGDDVLNLDDEGTWPAYPTGTPLLDVPSGIGGYPKGRIVECFGPPSSGKTTSALMALALAQKAGMKNYMLDYENAFDPTWGSKLGINIKDRDTFRAAVPRSLEQGIEAIRNLIKDPKTGIIIVDSVAAMTPQAILELDPDKEPPMALQARLLSRWLPVIATELKGSNACIIFINQLRDNLAYGGGKTTPGGKATPFYASMRVEFKQVQQITEKVTSVLTGKEEDRKVGAYIRATFVKNKMAAPFQRSEFIVREGYGIDVLSSIVEIGKARGVLAKSGSYLTLPAEFSHDGKERKIYEKVLRAYFREHDDVYQKFEKHVVSLVNKIDVNSEEVVRDDDDLGEDDLKGLLD